MGVDPAKLPSREEWSALLRADEARPEDARERIFVTWYLDQVAIGHSSVNKIIFGKEAFIHLHLWKPELRKGGLGAELFRLSVAYFFEHLRLERLWCEPYAENPGPNRVLIRTGFELIKRYRTTPGAINFEQDVNQYKLERDRFIDTSTRDRY